jgi:hypothetical protein
MTNDELDLLRQIESTGTSFVPQSGGDGGRRDFRILVRRARSLVAQDLIVADFLMPRRQNETDPIVVFCSLTELGQLALMADRLMPATITYTVDHESRTVLATARGTVAARDHEAHVRGLDAAGLFGYRRLEDYRGAVVDFTGVEMRRMLAVVQELRRRHQHPPTAFVTRDDVFYGMLRMYEALTAEYDHGFGVFLDRREAEAWLGAPERAKAG